jgi:transposase-like protein
MNIHKNARLTPLRREEMALLVIQGHATKAQVARIYGVSAKIVARWVERFKVSGRDGRSRHHLLHEQIGQCLGQRSDGKLLLITENGENGTKGLSDKK